MASEEQVGALHAESEESLVPPPLGREHLVSVIMIFRDPGKYFDEAVKSVLTQEYDRLELLLCDDGSGQAASDAARSLAAAHPARVRYLEHPAHANRGMSATRNLGIMRAKGDLIAFLDSDDVWMPGHLQSELALLEANPAAEAVCGQAVVWRSWADPSAADERPRSAWPTGTVVLPPLMLAALLDRSETRTPTCSLLVRRATLLDIGGGEEEFTGMYEDQALLAKLYLAVPVVVGGSTTARYRQHGSSASARAAADGRYAAEAPNAARITWLRWLEARLGARDNGAALLRAVRTELESSVARPSRLRVGSRRSGGSLGAPLRSIGTRSARAIGRRAIRTAQKAVLRISRTSPISGQFGFDRGLPVDRHYIERFLSRSSYLVRGVVLEVGDSAYTHRFGGSAVEDAQVLNNAPDPGTTIIADLGTPDTLPADRFDCIVLTQTLHLIWDLRVAVANLHDALRPGGVALVTIPFISQISGDRWDDTWSWGVTPTAARRLFAEAFGENRIEVEWYGNVRAATAFLEGFAANELTAAQLAARDPAYPMLVGVRAWRAS